MQRHANGSMVLLLLALAFSACSRQETQKSLARRLNEADRVVFTNPLNSSTMTVTNGHVKKLVEALEGSQEIPVKKNEALTITSGYTLNFFKGTNRLATIPTSHVIFW